jgi:phage/plasmid-like protein (TIGR03299 family)
VAHELETIGGQTAFVSAREHAWHKLGTVLPNAFTAAKAMQHAQLGGWNVRKEPLQTVVVGPEGVTTLPIEDKFATVRTNPATGSPEVLGVVGSAYRPIQNEAHCDVLDALVDESGAYFETAGSLKGGRQVFVTMKLPQGIQVGGVDAVDTYIAALNSHDGSTAFRMLVTPVRVVCANTQAAAIRRANASFSIQHSVGAQGRIQAAREALGLTFAYMDEFQAEADKMLDAAMTEAEFVAITRQLWPIEPSAAARTRTNARRRELSLTRLFSQAETNAAIRGTRWAGYQAVTEYIDHFAPVDGKRDAAAVRAERVVSGAVTDIKTRAFDLLAV